MISYKENEATRAAKCAEADKIMAAHIATVEALEPTALEMIEAVATLKTKYRALVKQAGDLQREPQTMSEVLARKALETKAGSND
jgi:hypothetical protein